MASRASRKPPWPSTSSAGDAHETALVVAVWPRCRDRRAGIARPTARRRPAAASRRALGRRMAHQPDRRCDQRPGDGTQGAARDARPRPGSAGRRDLPVRASQHSRGAHAARARLRRVPAARGGMRAWWAAGLPVQKGQITGRIYDRHRTTAAPRRLDAAGPVGCVRRPGTIAGRTKTSPSSTRHCSGSRAAVSWCRASPGSSFPSRA